MKLSTYLLSSPSSCRAGADFYYLTDRNIISAFIPSIYDIPLPAVFMIPPSDGVAAVSPGGGDSYSRNGEVGGDIDLLSYPSLHLDEASLVEWILQNMKPTLVPIASAGDMGKNIMLLPASLSKIAFQSDE